MKKRIRKTGEIIEVISYGGNAKERNCAVDYVSYIDSNGNEHPTEKLNFYWDLEDLSDIERLGNDRIFIRGKEDYVRREIAAAAMQGLLNATPVERFPLRISPELIAQTAVECADALINELNKPKYDND